MKWSFVNFKVFHKNRPTFQKTEKPVEPVFMFSTAEDCNFLLLSYKGDKTKCHTETP
jgi:hypothetical protein